MKFSTHINKISKTCNSIIGQVSRSFKNKSKTIMVDIFKLYIRPHLDYASPILNPKLRKNIDILESVKRRFTRLIADTKGFSYQERLNELGLQSLEARRE